MNTQAIVKVKDYLAQRAIFVVLILLVIGIAVADPNFLAFSTLRDILQQSSTRLIIALWPTAAVEPSGSSVIARM